MPVVTTIELCHNHSNERIRNYGVRMQCANAPTGTLHAVLDLDTIEFAPGEEKTWDITKYGHIAIWYYCWYEWFDGRNWRYVPQGPTYTAAPGAYFPKVGYEFQVARAEGREPHIEPIGESIALAPLSPTTGFVTVYESSDGGTGDPAKTVWQFFVGGQPVKTTNKYFAQTARLAVRTKSQVTATFNAVDGNVLSQLRVAL
jgi:hypothetical protein